MFEGKGIIGDVLNHVKNPLKTPAIAFRSRAWCGSILSSNGTIRRSLYSSKSIGPKQIRSLISGRLTTRSGRLQSKSYWRSHDHASSTKISFQKMRIGKYAV